MSAADDVERQAIASAVEIAFGGVFVRGLAWAGDANWVVLVHEPGSDLDAWGAVPAAIAADGYSVLAVDLPGHGLSDDPWEPARVPELIHALIEHAVGEGAAKVFVVAANEIATAAILVQRVDALVALSPAPFSLQLPARTPPALILVGGADEAAAQRAQAFFRQTRGWAVVSSFGVTEQGTAIFRGSWAQIAREQTLAFLRDYRAGQSRG